MNSTQIIENVKDLTWMTPREDEFKLITDAFVDCQLNGSEAKAEHKPAEIAHSIVFGWGDLGTPMKFMVIAAMLGWKELITELKPTLAKVGWKPDDIKTALQDMRTLTPTLEDLYEKYCEPALAAITTGLTGQAQSATSTPVSGGYNIKVLAQPTTTFCRLVIYDPHYGTPGARRHLYLTKKSGNSYRVSLGGATVTSWYNEPFFSSIQQAKDFINHTSGVNTSKNMTAFNYTITDKPVASGTNIIISDLSSCVPITSDCGPAYIHKSNQYCVESLEENLVEDVEKHEELNPAIFDENAKVKPEVKSKITEIVDEFLKEFKEVEVDLDVQDIILTGSNASYNYTKDSDLDIHIVADTSKIKDTLKLHKVIYDAYKSSFNKKFEIELNRVPVELYVETQDTPLVSNGIYSVLKDEWVKEPTKEDIPEVDLAAIEKAFKPWEKRYKALIAATTDEVEDEAEIDKFIDSLYELRAKGLSTTGEYSIENLVFKEMRNKGYLDALKELRHTVIARRLSLREDFTTLSECFDFLNKLI